MKVILSRLLGRQLLLLIAIFLFCQNAGFSQVCNLSNLPSNLQTGLVAYYPFCGNANDVSTYSLNGTASGATLTTDRFGNLNSAFNFLSGTDKILTAQTSDLNFQSSNFSISFWCNLSGSGPTFYIINFNQGCYQNPKYIVGYENGKILFHINGPALPQGSLARFYSSSINLNGWAYITIVRNGTELRFFKDGLFLNSTVFNLTMPNISSNLQIGGGEANCDGGGWLGKLDEVGFWNRALNDCEVNQIYNITQGISSSTIGYNSLPDTTRICGSSTTLNAGSGYSTYSWNTGATTQSISTTASGFYKVTVTNSAGCTASDSTYLSLVNANILNNDTTICLGNSIRLSIDSLFPNRTACTKEQLPVAMRDRLLAYYPFCGNANNAMGTGNNGTVYNATLTADRFGNSNSAYNFNGTNAYIDFGSNTSIGPTSTIPISISLWVSGGASGNVISKYTNLDASRSYFLFGRSANGYQWIGNGTNPYINNSGVSDNAWTHYVLVGVAGSNNSKVYRNGVLIATGTLAMNATMQAVSLLVGKVGASFPGFLNGKVDDIFIYNKALTLSEIQNLYLYQPRVTWSTNATTNSILVNPTQSTTYYVDITDGINTCRDSVQITVYNPATYASLSDTTRVCGTSTTLNAGSGYSSYLWNTGAATQTISPTTSGFYKVTVTNSTGCTASDSTYLSLVYANILNNDTTICRGSSVTLSIDSLFPGRTVCDANQLPSNLRNGLVGYWPFCNNVMDKSSTSNHGQLNGPVFTSDRFGTTNSALYFDQVSDVLCTSILQNSPSIFTYSLWIKSSNAQGGLLVVFDEGQCNHIFNWDRSLETDASYTRFRTYPGQNVYNSVARNIRDGLWHNCTISFGPSGSKLYIDGLLVSVNPNQTTAQSFAGFWRLGGLNSNGDAVIGAYDDFMFWNRILSDEEVSQLYQNVATITWSNGATTNSITVTPTQTTTYYVTVSDGITSCTDSVRVTVSDIGTFNPLSDTTRVCGTSTVLNAGSGYASYSWNTGSTSQAVTALSGGKYIVTVGNSDGCTATDSTYLSLVNSNILNSDTTICRGSSVTLRIDSLFPGRTVCDANQLSSNLRNGLVAYYPFCGNANDASGNGHNGTVIGATLTTDRFGASNSAYSIDGIDCPSAKGISSPYVFNNSREYSISIWFKSIDINKRHQTIINSLPHTTIALSYNHGHALGQIMPCIGIPNVGWTYCPAQSSQLSNPLNWHHAVVVKDSFQLKVYIDGVIASVQPLPQNINAGVFSMIMGAISFNGGENCYETFKGSLDDAFFYNRALNQQDVDALYTSQSTVTWSTGATTNSITVSPTQTTTYYVTVSDGISSCIDSVRITVADVDTSVVVLDPAQVCSNSGQVRMQAGQASTYQWLRNGVVITGATSRLYTATQTGTYRVALTNSIGCRDTSRAITISLYAQPISGFNTSPQTQCFNGNQFVFANSTTITTGTVSYLWNFGNGITSTLSAPTYTYPSSGTYIVKLVATSNNGCKDSTIRTLTVNPSPAAVFTVNNANQCITGNSFTFTNNSSISSGALTYLWSFGDGNTSTNANASHAYINSGTYTVKLVVTSALGCKDSTTRSVTVFEKPQVSFSINNASQCVNGNSFVFTNNTTISAGTVSYIWTFGDGGSANTTNALYSYTTPGTYVVKLVATSNNGCADSTTQTVTVNPKPTVNFSINAANQCLTGNQYIFTNQSSVSAGTLTHLWSFGDGNISIQPSTTYTYSAQGTYTVKLVSASALGCRDSISRSVTVYPMPSGALATPSTNLLCEGGNVLLSATGGNTYQWFINGGAIVGATNATHAATQPGTYTVNLISSNNCTAQATGSVTLQLVQKPTANFTYDKYCAGFPTQFNNQSNTANSNVVAYNWSFGTGQGTSTLQNPSYTFPTASVYSVSFVVTPIACPSLAASITKPVTTVAAPANQRYTSLNAVENRNLQLDARTFGGASYNWSPATGLNSATISNPIFNYNREVDYVITITTGIGCVIKDTQLVRIFKEKEIYVPKGFSPNGDGNNDKIFPRLVGVRTLTYFKVYNRWGQLLYQTSNINEGWDGTFGGTKQPMETYVWIAEGVDMDNNSIKRTGTFLLLR